MILIHKATQYRPNQNNNYSINDDKNVNLYNEYFEKSINDNVIFGGRLAEYKYYDMDDVILKALNDYKNISLN